MRFPILVVLALAACGGNDDTDTEPTGETGATATEAVLALAGDYTDQWGTEHAIDEVTWVQVWPGGYGDAEFAISEWSNAERFVIAENTVGAYFVGAWSRFDWAEAGGHLYYCQTAYDAADEDAARATPAADATDPTSSGCGGFPWTDLTP